MTETLITAAEARDLFNRCPLTPELITLYNKTIREVAGTRKSVSISAEIKYEKSIVQALEEVGYTIDSVVEASSTDGRLLIRVAFSWKHIT